VKFTVVTILPELIEPALAAGVVGRARAAGVIAVDTVNPRDFTSDRHRTVDDSPYGGGPGMVMKPEPLIAAIGKAAGEPPARRVLLTPAGAPLTQARVRELARLDHVVLVCGRYEGVDERAIDLAIDEELSIGDYVLSGGELAALVVIDAVARLVPGVVGEPTSVDDESFSAGLVEYPQYTRPPELAGRAVPAVLTSGNHAAIAAWRRAEAMKRTAARRPDLWRRFRATAADTALVPPLHARTHLALVHYPVLDRTGAIVTTSLTNLDVHDLARAAMTYGLAGVHVVTPIAAQRDKAAHIVRQWIEDEAGTNRADAMALVAVVASIDDVIADVTARHGTAPVVAATTARADGFAAVPRRSADALVAEAATIAAPLVILLGTGWGLADASIPSVSRVLAPIEGASGWNHLSVRSAGAVLLDRLFGRPA
jgi:tRNA (guanine37-N1)-methyltransferase